MAARQFSVATDFDSSQASDVLDILLIRLGGRSFGLPFQNIRQICPIPSGFNSYGPAVDEHFVFQGNPFPYVSLWNLLKLKSEYTEYEEMQEMLSSRRQDHLDWMSALEDAIKNGVGFSKPRNPRECAFGKWYYGYHTKNLRLSLLMRSFEWPHAEIHRLADKLLGISESGRIKEALQAFEESKNTTLAELLELFDSTQALLSELQRRIALIVSDGDEWCALGADGVRDIVSIPMDRIKQSSRMGVQSTVKMIVLDDETVIPLIDWRVLNSDMEMQNDLI